MRKLLVLTLVVMFVFGLVFVTGCKKKVDEPVVPADETTEPADDATPEPVVPEPVVPEPVVPDPVVPDPEPAPE